MQVNKGLQVQHNRPDSAAGKHRRSKRRRYTCVVVTSESAEQPERAPFAFRRPSAQKPATSAETAVELDPRGSRPSVSHL
ncbi:hypothetical protein M3Y99_01980800 [Aphelenchoides fujianensis]|nr:hypothetical protein M3Y99_01980800 [Aphelenchoides fujianensis]